VKQKQTTTTANTFYEYGMGQTVWAKAQACTAHIKKPKTKSTLQKRRKIAEVEKRLQ
jgi:hypothetical protein